MHFFDLHCDTLYRALIEGKSLDDGDLDVSFKKMCSLNLYIGCFAVWIPDTFRGGKAMKLFDDCVNLLEKSVSKKSCNISFLKNRNDFKKVKRAGSGQGIILSVEGGAVLGGKIKNIDYLYKKGVRIITLTWNGPCEIGDGIGVKNGGGLTEFGLKAVSKMEKLNMIIDLSHASEKLFYDVAKITRNPFVLSHSNSRTICSNPRNITDEQFKVVKARKGLIGVNFCKEFLSGNQDVIFDDVRSHIEHFLELGGENNLAFGSDFDGAEILEDVKELPKIKNLYEYFLIKNYNETLLDKIFFKNAFEFVFKNMG